MGCKLLHVGKKASAWSISFSAPIILSDKYLLLMDGGEMGVLPWVALFGRKSGSQKLRSLEV